MEPEKKLAQKNTKLVSIIITACDAEKFLEETIKSVLSSSYNSCEVIVVADRTSDMSSRYESEDERIRVFADKNSNFCHVLNNAVTRSSGEYILSIDAGSVIMPGFIGDAAEILEKNENVKLVVPRAGYLDNETGGSTNVSFSLHLLALENILGRCAMYRRKDWDNTGGFCEELKACEDWDLWISMLKDGGDVYRLPETCIRYHVRNLPDRLSNRKLKKHVINMLNKRHPEFFERELNGPLRINGSCTMLTNKIYRMLNPRRLFVNPAYSDKEYLIKSLPVFFNTGRGLLIHDGRNKLREFTWGSKTYVVKSFKVPHIINRLVYGMFRSSKAQRSYEYAELLRTKNIGSPEPVAWMAERKGILFTRSYYVSVKSECSYTYIDLMEGRLSDPDKYLKAIAHTTAVMHNNGILHKDYSRGNILLQDTAEGVKVEIVDLNRIRFYKNITIEDGCKNFSERLWATDHMRRVMAEEYASVRGGDADECYRFMQQGNDTEYSR